MEYGKAFPKKLKYGNTTVTTETLIGYLDYTKRKNAGEKSSGRIEPDAEGYFGYTSKREGTTKTYTQRGWIETKKHATDFKKSIETHFNKEGDLVWTPITSYKDYMTASQYGLFREEDYAAITSAALTKFFKRVGLKEDNMIWWMNYHTNKDHPHVHLAFLEKEKTRSRGVFTAKEIQDFKGFVFAEMEKRERLINDKESLTKERFKQIEFQKAEIKNLAKEVLMSNTQETITKDIRSLYHKLPVSGRLQYGSTHMMPYRKDLDIIVEAVLNTPEVKGKYEEISKVWKEMDERTSTTLHETITKVFDAEDKKLRTQIANSILNNFKTYNDDKQTAFIKLNGTIVKDSEAWALYIKSQEYLDKDSGYYDYRKGVFYLKEARLYSNEEQIEIIDRALDYYENIESYANQNFHETQGSALSAIAKLHHEVEREVEQGQEIYYEDLKKKQKQNQRSM